MLRSVQCRNFRSLEDVEIELSGLTALVGPNGSGKSAVLRALDLVLGTSYPTVQRIRFPHDFTRYESTRELQITARFVTPFELVDPAAKGSPNRVDAVRLSCKPYQRKTGRSLAGDPNFHYDPIDEFGDPITIFGDGNRGRVARVTTEIREHAACALIDHRRSVSQHTPSARGSALARLLEPAVRDLDKAIAGDGPTRRSAYREHYERAADLLRTDYVREIEELIDTTARQALGFLGATASQNTAVRFQVADPANPYAAFKLVYSEDGLECPAEEAGLGVQSAIVVGLFEALREKNTGAGIVLIDEPEMYLHPHAQRQFHRVLTDLVDAGATQVIYSTHSPVFADATRFETLRLLRRRPGHSTTVSQVSPEETKKLSGAREQIKLLTEWGNDRSEALFASAVLLVEGPGDQIAAHGVASRNSKFDLDGQNLSIIDCGGKSSIPFHAALCRALGIPVCALYDEDVWPISDDATPERRQKKEAENQKAAAESAKIEAELPATDRFVCSPTLEEMLGVGRNAKNKPLQVAEKIRAATTPEQIPAPLIEALKRLRELAT